MWVNFLLQRLFQVTNAFQILSYITICLHIMTTGLEPSNVLNLWTYVFQSMMNLKKYWVICENSALHFIVRWFFRVTYSSHMAYDCNGNMIFSEKLYVLFAFFLTIRLTTSSVDAQLIFPDNKWLSIMLTKLPSYNTFVSVSMFFWF